MKLMKSSLFLILGNLSLTKAGWIDPDTPEDKRTTRSFVDGTVYDLVMSDEFNIPNRSFTDGHDNMWTGLDKSDDDSSAAGGGSLHFYNSSRITTANGTLRINSVIKKTEWEHYDTVKKEFKKVTKYFESGMLQSWNKFCFTGGIIEVDFILPGDPSIGGLWPAAWMLGNLGRATYEASTNMIWPWSYNTCDRDLQEPQAISACNKQNHFGLNPFQGRGATEIDILEMMAGEPGTLPSTEPPISLPYADMTLQIAPGIPKDRPNSGSRPFRKVITERNGHPTGEIAQVWYDGLEFYGDTTLNPYFYGTYLGKTKPEEPVQRMEDQTYQADAVGAMHQLTSEHFKSMHSFRVEWQPGPGGRLDWYTKAHKKVDKDEKATDNLDDSIEGDGKGTDWVKVYTIKGESLEELMGSQIPNEPTYMIFNTAISSTWGFPYTFPDWCPKCFDCDDPKCTCSFHSGFCEMMRGEDNSGVNFEIDYIRIYQTKNHASHVGNPHTIGCDPAEYPTREFIKGNEYRYCRDPPFGLDDDGALFDVMSGGGKCYTDEECGSKLQTLKSVNASEEKKSESTNGIGRGNCIPGAEFKGIHNRKIIPGEKVCKCYEGFVGPHCHALNHTDDTKGVYQLKLEKSVFDGYSKPYIPPFFSTIIVCLFIMLIGVAVKQVIDSKEKRSTAAASNSDIQTLKRPEFVAQNNSNLVITGRSV